MIKEIPHLHCLNDAVLFKYCHASVFTHDWYALSSSEELGQYVEVPFVWVLQLFWRQNGCFNCALNGGFYFNFSILLSAKYFDLAVNRFDSLTFTSLVKVETSCVQIALLSCIVFFSDSALCRKVLKSFSNVIITNNYCPKNELYHWKCPHVLFWMATYALFHCFHNVNHVSTTD